MTKNEFLLGVVQAFLRAHPRWDLVRSDKRRHAFYIGRSLGSVFVYLGFTARTDRDVFGQSVGWAPSREAFDAAFDRKENPPVRLRDGQLARIRTLERPRDFEHEELSFPTASLVRPISGFRLSDQKQEDISAQMLAEIDEYALPYLCLMIKARHGHEVTPYQLGNEEVVK
jgi:hypothetical protein